MGFWSRRITNVAALMGGTAASTLLGGETDGLAIDFTDASLTVRDTTTTSNVWGQIEGNAQDFWRSRSFTSYSSPSPKITMDSDGYYKYRPHNLVPMSERFQSAAYTSTSLTITDNTVVAPDGTTTAATLALVDASATHVLNGAVTYTSAIGHFYTHSVYAKANTHGFIQLIGGSAAFGTEAYANFDVSTGVVGTAGTATTASIESVGSGWYRCAIRIVATAATTVLWSLHLVADASAARGPTWDPNSTNSLYAWGAMVNHGPTALTYVPTRAHNIVTQSQTLDNAAWTATSCTVTANSVAAPDGTTTAETLALVDAASTHAIAATAISWTSGLTYTVSVYAKANTHSFIQIQMPSASSQFSADAWANFNVSTGATSAAAAATATATNVGNGWYRCSITVTATATASGAYNILLVSGISAGRAESWDPNSTNSLYAWGAQVELASSPGKYVTTTTAAVYSANYDLPREWGAPNTVTNLCLRSQEFSSALWAAVSVTVTDNTVANPVSGASTAATVALVDASASHSLTCTAVAVTLGATYTVSVYAKADTHGFIQLLFGSAQFGLEAYANFDVSGGTVGTAGTSTTAAITSVGSGWYRCSISATCTTAGNNQTAIHLVQSGSVARGPTWDPNSTNSLYLYGAQYEQASTAGTYLHTTATARTDYFYPTSLACQGLLVEEARTNICLYARDLTQSNYTKTSATAALTATGVDGVANTASTLTASASNGVAYQVIASASAARSLSMFIRRRTGTGTVTISHGATTGSTLVTNGTFDTDVTGWTSSPTGTGAAIAWNAGGALDLARTDGSNLSRALQQITCTAGKLYRITVTAATANAHARAGTTSAGAELFASTVTAGSTLSNVFYATQAAVHLAFWCNTDGATTTLDNIAVTELAETDITSSINSSTWTRVSVTNETITNPCVAIKLATSGDAIDVDYCQSEAGAFITSPIYTGSASVTRAADNIFCATSVFSYSQSAVTMYGKGTPAAVSSTILGVYDATNNERYIMWNSASNPRALVVDGGVSQADIDAGTWTVGSLGKIAASIAANDVAASFNGGAAGTDTSATMPTVHTISIGNATSALHFNGYIAQAMVLPRAMSDAELVVVTT
jgi:hypothetical protein